MSRPPRAGGARNAILDAAAAVAQEAGVLGLTVDRVVERAGVSKGAFFYNFAGKDAMVAALLDRMADRLEAGIEERVRGGEAFALALVRATFAEAGAQPAFMAALIAAVAVDRALARVVSARTEAWTRRMVQEGVPESRAWLVRLALDGLLLSSALTAEAGRDADRLRHEQAAVEGLLRCG